MMEAADPLLTLKNRPSMVKLPEFVGDEDSWIRLNKAGVAAASQDHGSVTTTSVREMDEQLLMLMRTSGDC